MFTLFSDESCFTLIQGITTTSQIKCLLNLYLILDKCKYTKVVFSIHFIYVRINKLCVYTLRGGRKEKSNFPLFTHSLSIQFEEGDWLIITSYVVSNHLNNNKQFNNLNNEQGTILCFK